MAKEIRTSTDTSVMSALNNAAQYMGIEELKPKQVEAITTFVSGKDTFVSLPTGYGKSVVFAILPLLFDFMLGKSFTSECHLILI